MTNPLSNEIDINNVIELNVKETAQDKPLRECVSSALDGYFSQLQGHSPDQLYKMVLGEIEEPLLTVVLTYVNGNQTKAAELLGINRGTLRKKLKMYGLD